MMEVMCDVFLWFDVSCQVSVVPALTLAGTRNHKLEDIIYHLGISMNHSREMLTF